MKSSFSQKLQTSQLRNSSQRPLQSQKEESKLGALKLNKNGNSQSVKRINMLEFKQNVQKELDEQKRKLETMQTKIVKPSDDYFTNVYGPLTNKLNSIKLLRDMMQRNKAFDEGHFAIGCPCFHHRPNSKKKKLFVDHSWFDGKKRPPNDREMMPQYLDAMISEIYDDIPLDEGILVGEINLVPQKKKKSKINMLRERFNEVLIDESYPDIPKFFRLIGTINKPPKGKIIHFSFFEIESGEIINFEFENKGILTGKQVQNKIDNLEMSQFYIEIIFIEQDNVLDALQSSRPQSASSSSKSTELSSSSGFCRKKQSHFQIVLMQKQRTLQYSYDAIEIMRQLKNTDPAKLYRILTTYDPVYQESIISLCIIIRDVPLLDFLFTEIFTDANLTQKDGFFRYASIEIFNGFQKVSFKFDKDKKFFLQLQKRLMEQNNIQLSDFFFIKNDKLDYTPVYGSQGDQLSLILRQRSKSYSAIAQQFCEFNNLSELEFSSSIFRKLMVENSKSIDNIDLYLEYYRYQYFDQFVLPPKFENNSYQCLFHGNSTIKGGRQAAKKNNDDVRYYNILHHSIENKKNIDDIIRRYDETFVLFSQKDPSGNTPIQLLFKQGSSEQIQEFLKQSGQDIVLDLQNDKGENVLHSLYLNKSIINSEDVLGILGQDIINHLKVQKNKQDQYPLLYFLKKNLNKIKFSTLQLLIPPLEEQGDSIQFIRDELLPIINASIQNVEVIQFLINRVGIFQIVYKYPPAITKLYDQKQFYERCMQNLLEDENQLYKSYKYLNLKQLQWIIERDRSIIKRFVDLYHPIYSWYVRKRLESETQIQETSIIQNKNQKTKKRQILHNVIPLSKIKPKQRTEEVLKYVELLPEYQTNNQLMNEKDFMWSCKYIFLNYFQRLAIFIFFYQTAKVIYPSQDREIEKFFSKLFTQKKLDDGEKIYTSFKFYDYHAQKYFFCNQEIYESKKHLLFKKLSKLDKNFIFHFKQTLSIKNQFFIKDLHNLGFYCILEIKARPFVRSLPDQPITKKEKWFQTNDDFKKLMIQKHCNHLTNIPFSIARDDQNKKKFQQLIERLQTSPYFTSSLLELFLYHIIDGNAYENLRILSKYYFEINPFLRWCRELKINPSSAMIQVILDEDLIPSKKLVQMLCYRRYNLKLIEQNILANLDVNQIEVENQETNDQDNQKSKNEKKKKLVVSQMLFDLICVKIKVKNFTKIYEWASFILKSSISNRSRMSKQNKRYIFSQNWPDLWEKLRDPHTHSCILYQELQKKQKEKVQYKSNTSTVQPTNNKNNNLQQEKKSIIITNKDYFKKCMEVLNLKMKNNILVRIIISCIELGKLKWASKLFASQVINQFDFFSQLRYYNIDLSIYKQVFQQSSFLNKEKQQSSQMDILKYLVQGEGSTKDWKDAHSYLKKLERSESFNQIQQWIQRSQEEYKHSLAIFFIERYVAGLLNNYDNSSTPRKQIKKNEESLLPLKYRKKQEEYSQKYDQLLEKASKRMTKFKKEHQYNLINHKDESNKVKIGYQKVNIPANKSLKTLFGSPVIFNINIFQIEQLIETCIEILYKRVEIYYPGPSNNKQSYAQFLESLEQEESKYLNRMKDKQNSRPSNNEFEQDEKEDLDDFPDDEKYRLQERERNKRDLQQFKQTKKSDKFFTQLVHLYIIHKPERMIGIIQKMKFNADLYIKGVFTTNSIRINKKFQENIDYLSSKLLIKEYVDFEQAHYILNYCIHRLSSTNNNPIISAIIKIYGKDIFFNKLQKLKREKLKNILPGILIEYKNWLTQNDQKNGVKRLKQKPAIENKYEDASKDSKPAQSASIQPASNRMNMALLSNAPQPPSDSFVEKVGQDYDSAPSQAVKRQSSEKIVEQQPLIQEKDKEEEEEYEIEYQECDHYHIILLELASREALRLKLLKQSKKQQSDGTKILDISQFQQDLLNFDLSSIITERDLSVKLKSMKQEMKFNEYLLLKGLLLKNESVDERLIKSIQGNSESYKFIVLSQDSNYAKAVFDKLFQGKRSSVEQYMDENSLFFEMINRGSREEFIDKMLSYYYRKTQESLKLVELAIQNNMQKVFFSLIRSESDRNSIKQIIQNNYQYIKAFRHYDILNFALTELEMQTFNYTSYSKDNEEKTFLLKNKNSNWLSMKLVLAQESQLDSFNKTQKMFINLKQQVLQNHSRFFSMSKKKDQLSPFLLLSELVFDRNKSSNYQQDLAIIQSEILKSQILYLPEDANGKLLNDQSDYGPLLKKKFNKSYQFIYWLKYRHGQSALTFESSEDEQFILKIRDIVSKFGPLQLDFNQQQKALGISNEEWVYSEHMKFMDIYKNENQLFQIASLLNPNNQYFTDFMFNEAIFNSSLFIKLLPKLKTVLSSQQIEELLSLYVGHYLNKNIFRLQNQQQPANKNNTSKIGSVPTSPRQQDSELKKVTKSQFASGKDASPLAASSILQDLDSAPDSNKLTKLNAESVQITSQSNEKAIVQNSNIAEAQQQDGQKEEDVIVEAEDPQKQLFESIKSLIQQKQSQQDEQDQGDTNQGFSSLLEQQNALIILIKIFDSNYYTKVLCDNLDKIYLKEVKEQKVEGKQDKSKIIAQDSKLVVLDSKPQQDDQISQNDSIRVQPLSEDRVKQSEEGKKEIENGQEQQQEQPSFSLKQICFILSQMDQSVQVNCIKRLTAKLQINLKNCVDIGQFEQIVYFYQQYVEYLFKEPYNVKRIEIIYGNANKYQYFSSQNMLLTINYINVSEFEAFIQKEFEITENIEFCPFEDVDVLFNLKVSSKSFANNQVKTGRVIEYFKGAFQSELKMDENYFRNWLWQVSLMQSCKKRNIDLFANYYKDKPRIQSKDIGEGEVQLIPKIQNYWKNYHGGQEKKQQNSDLGDNLFMFGIDIIAKEIQSSEYIKLISPYERVKSMNTQLFLEKEVKLESTYFVYFFFDNSKLHIINTFQLTNIEPIKIIYQTIKQIPTSLDYYPNISTKNTIELFERKNKGFEYSFEINQESIKSEKNQNTAYLYCQKYLKQDLFIFSQQNENAEQILKDFIKLKYGLDEFKLKFICIEANEEYTINQMKSYKQDQEKRVVQFYLGFDFTNQPIIVSNSLIKLVQEHNQINDNQLYYQQPTFMTQFNSIYEIYRYGIVIDFISYFNTVIMNCSQLKLMFTRIPSQLEKVMNIIGENAIKHGFKYIMFSFTTTNQPFSLKSDCFKDPSDKFMRFGQTTYEVVKPFEDQDSSRFKSSSSILKVTLSLAFKHPAKELTIADKKDDEIEGYFYKITNEFELVKAVCYNRDVLRRFFNQQQFKVDSSSNKRSQQQKSNNQKQQQNIESSMIKSAIVEDKVIQQNNEIALEEQTEDHNKIFNLSKFDSIINQVFENNLKNQNDLNQFYRQVFEKINAIEIYLVLYKDVDLDNYKQKFFDDKYSKYLINLMTQPSGEHFPTFEKLQIKARKWVEENASQFQKECLNKLYQPIKYSSSQSSSKSLTYQFNKDLSFKIDFPEPQAKLSLTQSKIMDMKKNISSLLKGFTVTYKGEEKWNQSQWNAVFESCEGFIDAIQVTKLKSKSQEIKKFKKVNDYQRNKNSKLLSAIKSSIREAQNFSKEQINSLSFSNYFSGIHLTFTEGVVNNSQPQEKGKKSKVSDNIRVSFKHTEENAPKEDKVLLIDAISTSDQIRSDSVLQVLRAVVGEIKKGLPNQSYAPQQEHSKSKILRVTVQQDSKETFFKFKKKVHDMNQQELIQTFYLITLSSYYKSLSNLVKRQIKITFQTGLKKPVILDNQNCYKIKLSTFQTVSAHQLIVQDTQKFIPKCGLYTINCLRQLKMETVNDITANANWEIQVFYENQNKIINKSIDIKLIEIDPKGMIKFNQDENLPSEPIIAKFIYKKDIVSAYVKKSENKPQLEASSISASVKPQAPKLSEPRSQAINVSSKPQNIQSGAISGPKI